MPAPPFDAARLAFNRPEYEGGALTGGLQLRVDAPKHPAESPIFKGSTLQLDNVLRPDGSPTGAGTLGHSVGFIFNKEFFYDGNTGYKDRGVPLTRIDFTGYGASIFSHWQNPNAAVAATSQAHFDVFIGRAAQEVIQVRSLVYPWGIRVVRTITIFRTSSAYVYRFDTGWQAESDGIYDFRYNVYHPPFTVVAQNNPYQFHPGIVRGVFRVRNIRETNALPPFKAVWIKKDGESYQIKMTSAAGESLDATKVSFADRKLKFSLPTGDGVYEVEGTLDGGKLAGTYLTPDGRKDTWDGSRM